jgi:hypothetical protein
MRTPRIALLAAWLAVAPTAAASQVIDGRVFDASTRQPIAAVELKLVQGDRVVASTLSDSLGRFALRAGAGGRYHIAATRIGYADATTQHIDLVAERSVAAELPLSVTPVRVAQLNVVAPRDPYLEAAGFYERMRTGNGFYLTEREIHVRSAGTIVDVLRSARGVKTQRVNMRHEVYLTSPSCLPQIVVDGVTVRWGGSMRGARSGTAAAAQPLEELVKVAHIEAIEVYRAFNGVPPQYVGPNAHCGTILIWTRHR